MIMHNYSLSVDNVMPINAYINRSHRNIIEATYIELNAMWNVATIPEKHPKETRNSTRTTIRYNVIHMYSILFFAKIYVLVLYLANNPFTCSAGITTLQE